MTPSDLDVLIHYHCMAEPHPRETAPAVQAAIRRFTEDGIFQPVETYSWPSGEKRGKSITTTLKGRAWLEMILATPYPEQTWVDPRTRKEVK